MVYKAFIETVRSAISLLRYVGEILHELFSSRGHSGGTNSGKILPDSGGSGCADCLMRSFATLFSQACGGLS